LRVLLVCTEKLPVPPIRGGAIQTYIRETAVHLARWHELTVFSVLDPLLKPREEMHGIRFVRAEARNLEEYTASLVEFVRANRFDLIHIFNRPRLVLPLRKAAPGARLFLSLHNDMFEPGKIARNEAASALGELERIVTVSDYVGSRVSTLFPEAGPLLRTVYSGVDLDRFAPRWTDRALSARKAIRSAHKLGGNPVVLFVGRLSPKKGAHVLVHAMQEVAKKHPKAALVLVGSKWYGEDQVSDYVAYVRALASRSRAPVVTTGFVPPEEVPNWFWAADLFVCASQWEEPLARVHYEAMACGLPIITTDRGGNPEVVRGLDNGIVVEQPQNPSSFARPVTRLLGDPDLRERMGRRGRWLAEERFGWSRVVREIREVWER
jgi:spore coat protein SA